MTKLHIPDMSCGHCKSAVEAALAPLSAKVEVDMTARQVALTGPVDQAAVLAALNAIGFPAEILAK